MSALPSRWRSLAPRLATAVLLGAATTVAAAWAFSRRDPGGGDFGWWWVPAQTMAELGGRNLGSWDREFGASWWSDRGFTPPANMKLDPLDVPSGTEPLPKDILAILRSWVESGEPSPGQTGRAAIQIAGFGWPKPALAAVCRADGSGVLHRSGIIGIPSLGSASGRLPGLPTRVLPVGFIADTAVYSAAWLSLMPMPAITRLVRHRLRVSSGMCGSCGYDLQGSPGGTCPECGTAMRVSA